MANLNTNEKQLLEKLFQMRGGYVLNFSDRTFQEFFIDDIGIDIYDTKYNYSSGSKANRMRGFWQTTDDYLVGKSIIKLVEYIENQLLLGNIEKSDLSYELIEKAKEIGNKLSGYAFKSQALTENDFAKIEFECVSIDKLELDGTVSNVLKQRIDEINKCLKAKASLSTIFLCGSTLEGILLGIASKKPKEFNESKMSPKDQAGKVKQFQNWTLNNFIDVACSIRLLGEDVKKFSHALRDFRNYIHPYQQMAAGFDPDEHTAKICWQVLQAAIVQLSNNR